MRNVFQCVLFVALDEIIFFTTTQSASRLGDVFFPIGWKGVRLGPNDSYRQEDEQEDSEETPGRHRVLIFLSQIV